jgi:hypothetical protein
MHNLHEELSQFARAIVGGEAISAQVIGAYPDYPADVAIGIYRNNYRGNLHDALTGAYPVIVQLVGDDFFRYLARSYIERHPSDSANLHHYGAGLACFLNDFGPARSLPYLPDMARLEWAGHVAYFAEDRTPFSLENLAQIPPQRYAELILHTACQLVRSAFPVAAIWQAHQPGAAADFHIDLDSGCCIARVYRKQGVVQVGELSAPDADWLQRIQAGASLGAATAATLERYPEFDLQAALLALIADEALTGFSLEDAT